MTKVRKVLSISAIEDDALLKQMISMDINIHS